MQHQGEGAILLSLMRDPNLLSKDGNYWPDHREQRSKEDGEKEL